MEKMLDVKLIHPNRYQPASRRTFTAAQLTDLDSIAEIGLQQKPHARPHPEKTGEYELVFGHRRVAWWSLHQPKRPMPVDVLEADDRALFDVMIAENEDRLSTNAIEKAQMLKAYMAAFNLSQAEAGKHFHLATQGGVSNLLRLLELPAEVQALVAKGDLPERMGRALLMFRSLNAETELIKIAQSTSASDESDKARHFDDAIDRLIRGHAKYMNRALWKNDWTPGTSADILGETIPLPACAGCPFMKKHHYADICLRPACWQAKMVEYAKAETAKAAKTKGIAVAAPGEKVKIIGDPVQAKALVASKSPAVRLVALKAAPDDYMTRDRFKQVQGTEFAEVAVLASQAEAVLKTLPKAKATKAPKDWQVKQREANIRRAEYTKARDQVVEALTPAIARRLPGDAPTLALMVAAVGNDYWGSSDHKMDRAIRDQWKDEHRITAKAGEMKIYLAHAILDRVAAGINSQTTAALQKAFAEFGAALKLQWPAGWDAGLVADGEKAKGKDASSRSAQRPAAARTRAAATPNGLPLRGHRQPQRGTPAKKVGKPAARKARKK